MRVPIISVADGSVLSDCEVLDNLLNRGYRPDILNVVVNWQLACRRAGTHSTKNISAISGTTAKPFRQKGTGKARQGSLRSPQFRGGAVIFGPKVRSHAYKLNKKLKINALAIALSYRMRSDDLLVVDDFSLDCSKTADVYSRIDCINKSESLLVVDVQFNAQSRKVVSNLPNINFLPVVGLNVFDILNHSKVLVTIGALRIVEARLK